MSIINIPSPNFTNGRAGYAPIAIVIHIMEGTLNGTDSWFQNPASKVSAHYGVGKNGEVHQYVNEKNTAWHAGRVASPQWKLIKRKGAGYLNPNYYTVGIEHEGNVNTEWTEQMYAASSSLIKSICEKWKLPIDRDHIVGHHEIYAVKACPGNKVNFDKLIGLALGNYVPVDDTNTDTYTKTAAPGKVTTMARLNLRKTPSRNFAAITTVNVNTQLAYDGYTNEGESVDGNSKWYYTDEGNWFWSGAVK